MFSSFEHYLPLAFRTWWAETGIGNLYRDNGVIFGKDNDEIGEPRQFRVKRSLKPAWNDSDEPPFTEGGLIATIGKYGVNL